MNEERRTRLMQAHELPDWALKDDDDIVQQVQEATQEIGRASCRERVQISVVAVSLKKKNKQRKKKEKTKKREKKKKKQGEREYEN